MRRRRSVRVVVLLAVMLGVTLVLFALRRGPRRPRAAAVAAGGVASPDDLAADDDGGAPRPIIEDARRYAVRMWPFGLDRYELRIEDAGMTTALDAVLARSNATFVVNAGFFDPEGKPVGLAVSNGVVLSKLARSLSGGVLLSDGASASLFPAEGFSLPETGGTFAIQCRPRLVVEGVPNVKSDDGKRAERTALCTRDRGRTLVVVIVRGSDDGESPGPSLYALGRHLADVGCEAALNLDGGPSTGAAWREADETKLLAPRGKIRHVLALHERP